MPTTVAPGGPKFSNDSTRRAAEIDEIYKKAPKVTDVTLAIVYILAVGFFLWTMLLATHYWHGLAPTVSLGGNARGVPYDRIISNAAVTIALMSVAISIQVNQIAKRKEHIQKELAKLR